MNTYSHPSKNLSTHKSPSIIKQINLYTQELDVPFYFTPSRMAGVFHCTAPSLEATTAALLHAGFSVSRSHALAGSIKTNATMRDVHDVFRGWVRTHPVKAESIKPGSPAAALHAAAASSRDRPSPGFEANFGYHPEANAFVSSKFKLVRYQQHPTPNWGPGSRPKGKRKREDG